MTPQAILSDLWVAGICLRLTNDGLNLSASAGCLSPEQRALVQSGNPAGRKPGTGEVAAIRAAIAERVPELLAALMTKALDGDIGAARLLLERAIAPLKGVEQAIELQLPNDGTLTAKAAAVLNAAAAGDLAPGQAGQLIAALGTLAKISEVDELAARITLLEQQHGKS